MSHKHGVERVGDFHGGSCKVGQRERADSYFFAGRLEQFGDRRLHSDVDRFGEVRVLAMWIGGIHAAGSVGGSAAGDPPAPLSGIMIPSAANIPAADCRIGAYCGNTRLATDQRSGQCSRGSRVRRAASKPANEVHDFLLVIKR